MYKCHLAVTLNLLNRDALMCFFPMKQGCQTRFSSGATSGNLILSGPDHCNHCTTTWL